MRHRYAAFSIVCALAVAASAAAQTTTPQKPFEPTVGQPGKDVVWVPTPQSLVDKMLDMAHVTATDVVMDLGSGDGRTVITAAKRGAIARGVEYDPDMVELSKKNAAAAGVTDRASFVKEDLFQTDLTKASVITMFLLQRINLELRPKLLELKPGTRVVSNSFTMDDWEPDEDATVTEDCAGWCHAMMWIVPAKVAGTWKMPQGDLTLTQQFQKVSGTLGATPIADGRLRGDMIVFTADGVKYEGRVDGDSMQGTAAGQPWTAVRQRGDGGIVRGPTAVRQLALVFTGHEYSEGADTILDVLSQRGIHGSFFLTGAFLRDEAKTPLVRRMVSDGHYVGPHSDGHLLYCPWTGPKVTLVSREAFTADMERNLDALGRFGIKRANVTVFLPPYEWYNAEIVEWTRALGMTLVNYTPGTRSNADYTEEGTSSFVPSSTIFDSILRREREDPYGLNGYLLLLHVGSGPGRADKFHRRLDELIGALSGRGYRFVRIDAMLDPRTAESAPPLMHVVG